ncbi:LETM1-like protein-domain-containing protein [Dunaliella salina]|uniref:Mitochondrial proton/calcium exchanger protein n=1 Tax=Dunaliella salina TaxID=3046 RepID=A0ABQ7G6W6_DUNSA|nr:LETM1-like protein-domain-containing protein [Dunaliella salina]|eukprot:KAF5830338.1 LETM1-like protein-domain-containing protein [Dunaliella salina]
MGALHRLALGLRAGGAQLQHKSLVQLCRSCSGGWGSRHSSSSSSWSGNANSQPASLLGHLLTQTQRQEEEQQQGHRQQQQHVDVSATLVMQPHGQTRVLMCGRMAFLSTIPTSHPWLSPHLAALSLHNGSLPSLTTMRHVSFIRTLSNVMPGGSGKGKGGPRVAGLPDAADADAAIRACTVGHHAVGYQGGPGGLMLPVANIAFVNAKRKASKKGTLLCTQMVWGMLVATKNGLVATGKFLWTFPARVQRWRATPPEEWARWRRDLWQTTKHEAHHYWGIPFLELLLPVLLKVFPNMLPSTFEDKLKKEEKLKQRLVIRLEMAKFLQDTVAEMAKDISQRKGTTEADDLYQFVKKVRSGQEVENAEIVRFARLFNDELTLDNLQRVQLVGLCHFVGISPLGTDAFLRSRLRKHLNQIKKDDYEIEQEGKAGRGRAVDSVAAEQGVVKEVDPTKALQQKLEFLKREEAAIRAELARSVEAEKAAAKSAAAKKIVRTAATAAIKEALKEEERAAQAAVASSSSHPSTGHEVDPASVSAEEAAEEEAQAREKRLRDITNALLDLATGSGVAKERKVFMDLMRNEIDRVNTVLAKSGQGTSARAMLFDTMGLRVSGGEADEKQQHEADPDVIASGRGGKQVAAAGLNDRVTRMLASIEKELDAVESKIGTNMHVLDKDQDGVISKEEVEKAVSCLRDQLSSEDLNTLLCKLGAAAQGHDIKVSELLSLASKKEEEEEEARKKSERKSKAG